MNLRTPNELLVEIKEATKEGEIALAKRLGISQPTVNRILRGQPSCSSKALLAIQRVHAEVTQAAANAAPVVQSASAEAA
ncbi:MAG: hypothetical protein EPN70_03390 [Paraburkholderia sp.]|uniref:hypothetical protein n=1 Tax=Paraburkholderia sp. TaxID=1926495 RepID=UPI0012238867|nr:hypothetical protein [Paraburkholderia sp.]TAM07228.1 MAG: hypothetical protein EPN70_03390 [Paraburkholderia sp.]TAM32633.1 MAG: hypothetical protein EPN59_01670 [Paraburkholderia sp.]